MSLFIVIEGIDGSGTTTQAGLLKARLLKDGHPVMATGEPSAGPVGRIIRGILSGEGPPDHPELTRHELALLFAADRLNHLKREILPALEKGRHVISDRYLLSSLAYQSLDCNLNWVREINREARLPDLTILLDLPAETAMQRIQSRGAKAEIFENLDLQRRIRKQYLDLTRELYAEQNILTINAAGSIDDVHQAIVKEVERRLKKILAD